MSEAAATVTPFERIGGAVAVAALVNRFYDLMDSDPRYARLRAIHAPDLSPMRRSLTGFLTGWMGGPRDWFGQGKCVMSAHHPYRIDADLSDQWTHAMRRALDEQAIDADLRDMLATAFGRVAATMQNA